MTDTTASRWTIGRQAFVLGMLPASLMFLSLVIFFTQSRLQEARLELVGRAQLMANQLAPALEFDMISGNHTTMQTLLRQVSQARLVYFVEVRDYYGNVLGKQFGPDAGPPFLATEHSATEPEVRLVKVKAEIQQTSVNLESPFDLFDSALLQKAPLILGQVEIAITEDFLTSSQNEIVVRSLSVGLLLFLFTWLLSRIVAEQIARPIRDLTAKIDALATGNYNTLPVTAKATEISRLSGKIDELAAAMQASERKRQSHLLAIQEPIQGNQRQQRSLQILVVEDNPVNMKITCGLLNHMGHQTDQAYNGVDALKQCKSKRYDVILMDCQMPFMDGFEATREIRRHETEANATGAKPTLIIALTANIEDDLEKHCRLAGMNLCLSKPVKKQALQACLENVGD